MLESDRLDVTGGRAEERGDRATKRDSDDDHDERDDGDQDAVLCHRLTLLTAHARDERAREGNKVIQQGFTSSLLSCRLGRVYPRGETWPTGVTDPRCELLWFLAMAPASESVMSWHERRTASSNLDQGGEPQPVVEGPPQSGATDRPI